jgi:integrase
MLVAQGADPQREKRERRRITMDLAFDRYLERFERDCLKVKWTASHGEATAMLERYAVPVLMDKPPPEIGRPDITAVLPPLRDKPASASKLFAILRRLFNWAISEGDLAVSPLAGMELPAIPQSRDRVLSDDELGWVWKGSLATEAPFGPLVRLLLLTGARREEVAGMA